MNNNLVNEQWKQVEVNPNYEVSDLGNIKSHYSGKILKPFSDWLGYLKVNLYKDGKKITKKIHRLVAIAFIPNPLNLPCIDHISGCKTDNRACNLRWCTQKENINYDNHRPLSEELKARLRESYQRNKDYYNNYYQENKELLSEYYKQNYQANRQSKLEYLKQYQEAHKEQRKDYMKQYYLAHKEQLSEYLKLYYQQNKEKWQKQKSNKMNV